MHHNKPTYSFFKNSGYALTGLREVFKHETSFKIEIVAILCLWAILLLIPMPLVSKLVLAFSLFIIPISELANSAIERVVDLVTKENRTLAKHAKDAGSAMVFLSITLTILIWSSTIFVTYFWD